MPADPYGEARHHRKLAAKPDTLSLSLSLGTIIQFVLTDLLGYLQVIPPSPGPSPP